MGSQSVVLPDKVINNVPHVQQQYNWDCGLACSKMALRFLGKPTDSFSDICVKLNFGHSVWTIDLAHIMKEYDVKHKLCTITAGVDKSYSKQHFYKDRFTTDEARVNHLFTESVAIGLVVQQRSVPLEEILEHLGQGHIAVVLIDWNVVYQQMCTDRIKCLPSVSCVRNCVNIYQGHFIIACGYSKKDKLIFYHNPATGTSSRDGSSMPMKIFEVARKSYGTDEDILFIFKNHTV